MAVLVTSQRIHDHVQHLGENFPPISLASVDRTIINPAAVRNRFSTVLDYMARVEMEVERNVLELLVLLPGVDDINKEFYADVWAPQELQHGLILDRLGQDLGMPTVQTNLDNVSSTVKMMGTLSHLPPVQEIIKLLYYLTGAATERAAVVAYGSLKSGLEEMNEKAIVETIINPIKIQEPGHFAFYKLSADNLVQSGALALWQLNLVRFLRSHSFRFVGANNKKQRAQYGKVIKDLDLDQDFSTYARDIARVETHLLWSHKQGLKVPGYVLKAFHDAVNLSSISFA